MSTSPGTEPEVNQRVDDLSTKKKRKGIKPGAPRFACPQCQRSFGRVEHLKRHLGSHTEERPFKCQTCDKAFLRSDTLQRHEVIHEAGHNQTKPKGARACFECAAAKVKCNNCLPCARCTSKAIDCKYPADAVAQPHTFTDLQNGGASDLGPQQAQLPSAEAAVGSSRVSPGEVKQLLPSISSITGSGAVPTQASSPWEQSFTNVTWMATDTASPDGLGRTGLITPGVFTSIGETSVATQQQANHHYRAVQPSEQDDLALQDDETSNGVHRRWLDTVTQNATARHGRDADPAGSQAGSGVSHYYVDTDGAGWSKGRLRKQGQILAHARPEVAAAGTSPTAGSTLLGFTPVALREHEAIQMPSSDVASIDDAVYQKLNSVFQQLCVSGEPLFFRPFDDPFFPYIDNFHVFIQLYIKNATEMLPIIHVPTLDLPACHWTLILAMAAIGSLFLDGETAARNSFALQEFMHRAFIMLEESMDPALTSIDAYTARVLHCLGMSYSGDQVLMRRAFRQHGKLADESSKVWQRAMDEFWLPDGKDHGTAYQAWHTWVSQERWRRVGYAVWLLDFMMCYHHDRQPILGLEDASCHLPCPEIIWEAQTPTHWKQLMQGSIESPSLTEALKAMIQEGKMRSTIGEFSRVLIIHGLYRRMWEARSCLGQPLTYWTPTAERQKLPLVIPDTPWIPGVPVYCQWRNETCASLDILHWAANAVIGAASGVEHPTVAHLHLSRVILLTPLETIRRFVLAITGYETYEEAEVARLRSALKQWTQSDDQKARLAMIHSGSQLWHLRKFRIGAFYEPHAVLLSILALWVFGTFTDNEDIDKRLPRPPYTEEEPALPSAISLDRPADDELVQTFVKRGSRMLRTINGVDVCAADGPQKVLLEGIKLLGGMTTWGAAEPAIRLLEVLSEVPREVVLPEPG